MNEETAFIHKILPVWVHSWARARGTPPPIALPDNVLQVDVGLPDQLVRYVMPGDKLAVAEKLANELSTPATWLKICAPRELLAPLLPPRWQLSPQRYFMHTVLNRTSTLDVPQGYALELQQRGPALHATLLCVDGSVASDGRVLLTESYAVFDTIGTEAQHQRKGLGRLVMRALANHALAQGAVEGLLVATEDGQNLYRTIGWRIVSPYTSAFIA